MKDRHIRVLAVAVTALALAAAPLGVASASNAPSTKKAPHIKVVVRGLDAPSQVAFGPAGNIYVGSLVTGNVVRAAGNGGQGQTVFRKVGSTGVAPVDASTTYLLAGEGGPAGAKLYKGNPQTGHFTQVANLKHYEKVHNPDGQRQCTGKTCDSLSNPYSLLRTTQDILIADAGANDIIAYNIANRHLHTFHVFANITDGTCKNAKNNDPRHPGCDPVPTGLARGPGNTVFVSLLGAERKNAARVVELDLQTGAEIRRWGHMTSVDGVAVSKSGEVYASELEYGLDPKNPNFNTTGRIVRIDSAGNRTFAHVATPGALAWFGNRLYASSHLAEALFAKPPQQGKGEVVQVGPLAFHKK